MLQARRPASHRQCCALPMQRGGEEDRGAAGLAGADGGADHSPESPSGRGAGGGAPPAVHNRKQQVQHKPREGQLEGAMRDGKRTKHGSTHVAGQGQRAQQGESAGAGRGGAGEGLVVGGKVLRRYGQRQAKPDSVTDADAPVLSEGVLRLIAGKQK